MHARTLFAVILAVPVIFLTAMDVEPARAMSLVIITIMAVDRLPAMLETAYLHRRLRPLRRWMRLHI